MDVLTAAGWVILGLPTIALVTFLGGRLLGARRGWLALTLAGFAGWISGVIIAGEITAWRWSTIDMVLVTIVLGTLFTMIIALGIDLLAPVGSLKQGEEAGLVKISNPFASMGRRRAIGRRYRRQDEIGTPLCVTVDFDSLEDNAVTIRHRDSTEQVRVPIAELSARVRDILGF